MQLVRNEQNKSLQMITKIDIDILPLTATVSLFFISHRTDIETPQPCLSNPVTLDGPSNTTYVLYQDVGGQVLGTQAVLKTKSTPQFGKWLNVGGTLSFSEGIMAFLTADLMNLFGIFPSKRIIERTTFFIFTTMKKDNFYHWRVTFITSKQQISENTCIS